jgi:hypothetical protein
MLDDCRTPRENVKRTDSMPKILVLFAGQPTATVTAVADGARSIRFSEVELRRVGPVESGSTPDHHQTLAGADEMVPYDAVIVSASEGGTMHPEVGQLLERAAATAARSAWQHKVGSAFMPEPGAHPGSVWPVLATLGNLGMLVVAPSAGSVEAGRELGARVAQVVGWVTHARSHHHHDHAH